MTTVDITNPPVDTAVPMNVHPGILNIPDILGPLTLEGGVPDSTLISTKTAMGHLQQTWSKLAALRKEAGGLTVTPGLEPQYLAAVDRIVNNGQGHFNKATKYLSDAIQTTQAQINSALVDTKSRPELQAELRSMVRDALPVKPPVRHSNGVQTDHAVIRSGRAFSMLQSMGLPGIAAALAVEHCPSLIGLTPENMEQLRGWAENKFAPHLCERRKALRLMNSNMEKSVRQFQQYVTEQKNIRISSLTKVQKTLSEAM